MTECTTMKVYTLDEVASLLNVRIRTLYAHISSGQLKAVKVGRGWKISDENLRAFMSSGDGQKRGELNH